MDRPTGRAGRAIAGTLVVLVVVPILAVALLGQSLLEPDLDRPAWALSLTLALDAAALAAGVLAIGALGWLAHARVVDGVYVVAGAALLSLPAIGLIALETYPSVWVSALGNLGAAMLLTGAASLVLRRSPVPGDGRPKGIPWSPGSRPAVIVALAGSIAIVVADMGFSYLVMQWYLSEPGPSGLAISAEVVSAVLGAIGIVIDAAAVLLVGALAIRARSLVAGAAYALAGAALLMLPTALTILGDWWPWWLGVIPAAAPTAAAMLITGCVSIGQVTRDRSGRAPTALPAVS